MSLITFQLKTAHEYYAFNMYISQYVFFLQVLTLNVIKWYALNVQLNDTGQKVISFLFYSWIFRLYDCSNLDLSVLF